MMKESYRERESDSLGHEGSQLVTNGIRGRKDFRKGLFSIFIDNLNPCVDLKGLWDFLKSFGKVRDVFLSSKMHHRRSFGFVRFESLDEASEVSKMVNGMLVYDWRISAKVASYGWERKKFHACRYHGECGTNGCLMVSDGEGKECFLKAGLGKNRNFVKVVRGGGVGSRQLKCHGSRSCTDVVKNGQERN
ncbi:hypothetical protein Ddye_026326 [Dipteronia dyeriana]|uniref:RRM domain-containing protein n=1 Tax=Dipteronia dyeriana TaxID=168575 RepID=A0AAD9TM31_9ROSI|nr:hypothetical protein Ddye_026326 [Dipteronia dyeriana]